MAWQSATVLTVCFSLDTLQQSWESASVLTICNSLDIWTVLTVCNFLNGHQLSWYFSTILKICKCLCCLCCLCCISPCFCCIFILIFFVVVLFELVAIFLVHSRVLATLGQTINYNFFRLQARFSKHCRRGFYGTAARQISRASWWAFPSGPSQTIRHSKCKNIYTNIILDWCYPKMCVSYGKTDVTTKEVKWLNTSFKMICTKHHCPFTLLLFQ